MPEAVTRESITAEIREAMDGAIKQRDTKTVKACLDSLRQLGNDRPTEQDNQAIALLVEIDAVPTALYRHFDHDGRLLYVGISLKAITRTMQHRNKARWFRQIARIELQWFGCRSTAEMAEQRAIETEKPLYNITHNKGNGDDPEKRTA